VARKKAYAENATRNVIWQWAKITKSEDEYVRDYIREELEKNLEAKIAAVKAKGYFLRDVQKWHDRFKESNDALLEFAQKAASVSLQAEYKSAVLDPFYIFEHERTPIVTEKMAKLAEAGQEVERIARLSADVEYQHEVELAPLDNALKKEGNELIQDIEKWSPDWPCLMCDKPMSKALYRSFASRIGQWSKNVDILIDLELKAQAEVTGSGPVSWPDQNE
jgi:hypothetical protein